jgi:hypothetical protein
MSEDVAFWLASSANRLVVCTRRHPSFDGEMDQKRLDFGNSHRGGMRNAMKPDEPHYPMPISLLHSVGHILGAGELANLILSFMAWSGC